VRSKVGRAIDAPADQPVPEIVIQSWMKFQGYGEPVEEIEAVIDCLYR